MISHLKSISYVYTHLPSTFYGRLTLMCLLFFGDLYLTASRSANFVFFSFRWVRVAVVQALDPLLL